MFWAAHLLFEFPGRFSPAKKGEYVIMVFQIMLILAYFFSQLNVSAPKQKKNFLSKLFTGVFLFACLLDCMIFKVDRLLNCILCGAIFIGFYFLIEKIKQKNFTRKNNLELLVLFVFYIIIAVMAFCFLLVFLT